MWERSSPSEAAMAVVQTASSALFKPITLVFIMVDAEGAVRVIHA